MAETEGSDDDDGGLLSDDAFRRSPLPLAARIAARTGDGIAAAAAAADGAVSRSQPVRRKGKGKGKALRRTLRLDEGRSRSQPNPAPASAVRSASTDANSATDAVAVAEVAAADDAIPKRALFYGCYLLTPIKTSARSYVGFTVNPARRLRQHNGEIKGGAAKTKRGGPWRMLAVVYGFPNQISALRFEWAWQNPGRSTRLKELTKKLKNTPGDKVKVLAEMLRTPTWARLPLVLHWLDRSIVPRFEELMKPPPAHMPIAYGQINPKLVSCTDPLCDCTDAAPQFAAQLDPADASETESESEGEPGGPGSPIFEITADDRDLDASIVLMPPPPARLAVGAPSATSSPTVSPGKRKAAPAMVGTCGVCGDEVKAGEAWLSCRKPVCVNKRPRGSKQKSRENPHPGPASNDPGTGCSMVAHTRCLAEYMLSNGDEPDCCIPVEGACPGSGCDKTLLWGDLIKATLQR